MAEKKSPRDNPILVRTAEAGKTYSFREDHDHTHPADIWFQQTHEGPTLFVVFYTQACRWAQCLGCNLPSRVSANHVHFSAIMKQVDFLFNEYLDAGKKAALTRIIVSNNGSVLDERTFSTTALLYLVAMVTIHCPAVRIISFETRPEYVDWTELEVLARALSESETPKTLELAVGFEAFDDHIRNDHFRKGLTLEVFEAMARKLAPYGFQLKVYLMQKPVPGMTEEEAMEDVEKSIRYLADIAREFNLDVNVHLNPTYVARGTVLEREFFAGRFQPPKLSNVLRSLLTACNTPLSVFVGLYDEGLAVPGGSCIGPDDQPLVEILEAFNRTQDYSLLTNWTLSS